MFFSNAFWPQLLAPLEMILSKISQKYIPIHIYFLNQHIRVTRSMKLSSQDFLFDRITNIRKYPEGGTRFETATLISLIVDE